MRKLFLFLCWIPQLVWGQHANRLEPGKMYEAGETLFAPRFGFTAMVPEGWSGLLPRESEVFLLTSQSSPAEVFVFGREKDDMALMKTNWEKGVDLDANLKLQAKSAILKNGVLHAEAILIGSQTDKSKRGYVVARCSEFGPCITMLAVMPATDYERIKDDVNAFMMSAVLSKPSSASPYENFDWRKFLGGKMMITYANMEGGSKESKVELCGDGYFTATISKRGILKNQNPAYRGKLTGTWTAEGIGESGKLILSFDKKNLPDLEANLLIRDEKIYANNERYFAGASEKCK